MRLIRTRVAAVLIIGGVWGGIWFPDGIPRREAMASGPRTFKVAFLNIQSGKGEPALVSSPFPDTSNCTDPTQPLNAWGLGIVQRELTSRIRDDAAVIALGLGEAWVCGNESAVMQVLGWKAKTTNQNGVALVARYGFAGPEQWLQLDTTRNLNPRDTMWVLRVPVCVDSVCSRSILIFAAHWYGSGLRLIDAEAVFEIQSQQTIDFMNAVPAGQPEILLGDLNVFEGTEVLCEQPPRNRAVRMLREAGYLDAWPAIHGLAEGNTGMWNRATCGTPRGNLFKRIDYTWSKSINPLSMTRFGMVTPGEAAPSDHAGIITEFPMPDVLAHSSPPTALIRSPGDRQTISGPVTVSVDAQDDELVTRVELLVDGSPSAVSTTAPFDFTWNTSRVPNGLHTLQAAVSDDAGNRTLSTIVSVNVANPVAHGDEIVLYAADATIAGNWKYTADSTAAGGVRIQSPDAGVPRLGYVPTRPTSYVDLFFDAVAGKPYRLWIRGKAEGNSPLNDAVYVQFNASVDASGLSVYRMGTTTGLTVNLEDCDGCGLSGWGWQDTAVEHDVLGPVVYFAASGRQQLRIQAREDGIGMDQFVLSSVEYLSRAPGAPKDDATIVGRQPQTPVPNILPFVVLTGPAAGSTFTAPASIAVTANASDVDGVIARVDLYAGTTLIGTSRSAPYSFVWTGVAAGTYSLSARAVDDDGGTTTSASVTVQVANPSVPGVTVDEVVLYATTAPMIVGNWVRTPDTTAAGGARLQNPNAGLAKAQVPLAAPDSYFELSFNAEAGKAYRLWLRARAEGDAYTNDSVYVQFDGSVDSAGAATNRIGTTSATTVVLEDCSGCGVKGWGWQDNGYGVGVLGPLVRFATTGPQRVRIQVREDGIGIDQVVLSAVKYVTSPPGTTMNDTTILPSGTK